jgi:hypothetical protein
MRITRKSLDEAVSGGILAAGQADALWSFLTERDRDTPSFKPAHILYYLGGLIAIGAMSLFMTLGWEQFRGAGLLFIASAYVVAALGTTEILLYRKRLAIPAGLTAALAVALVPLAVYGAQHMLGYWPPGGRTTDSYRDYHAYLDWRWIFMELATLAAGAAALWRYRLPFLVMPVAVTLWYMSMDLVPLLLGGEVHEFFSDTGKRISMAFGLCMTLVAFWVDVRTVRERDFAFWLYVFGVLTFWGGLSALNSNSELAKLAYCGINVLMIVTGAALSRRVFAVFGGLGIAGYLGHLSWSVFRDSLLFPVALTGIGMGVIWLGVKWQRHEAAIGDWARQFLPAGMREFIEHRAG